MDKLDTKVASDLFTLRDEPHAIGANGSRYFDNEGVACLLYTSPFSAMNKEPWGQLRLSVVTLVHVRNI